MKSINFQETIETLMAGNSQVVYQDNDIFICENLSLLPSGTEMRGSEMMALLFCAAGRAQVSIGDRVHEVEAGDVLVCNMDTLAECLFSQDFRYAVVGMTVEYVTQLMAGNSAFMEQYLYIREHPVLRVEEEVHTILPPYALMLDTKIRQRPHPYHRQTVRAIIQSAIYEILGYYEEQRTDSLIRAQGETKPGGGGSAALFKRFLVLLAQDDCQHRNVGYFADELCVTAKYLSAVCRRESQRTPLEWIHSALVQRIRHLLLHTDMSVKEIATQMGFANLSFFGKFVHTHLGMSPSEFRKKR